VGKKAANVVSNSERDNKHDSSYSSLLDDITIIDCLLNLSCISSNKRRKKRDVNRSKTSNLYYYSVEHCYLNLSKDMVEDRENCQKTLIKRNNSSVDPSSDDPY
jgi:hypothetical protein